MAKKNKAKRTVRKSAINSKGFSISSNETIVETKTYTEDNLFFDLTNAEVTVISYFDC